MKRKRHIEIKPDRAGIHKDVIWLQKKARAEAADVLGLLLWVLNIEADCFTLEFYRAMAARRQGYAKDYSELARELMGLQDGERIRAWKEKAGRRKLEL